MKGEPTGFWGKLEQVESGEVLAWHPLLAHCADVAAVTEALLQHTLVRRRLAALARRDRIEDADVARLSAIAALHDIGKFNRGFQRKADPRAMNTAGHVREVLALIGSSYREHELLERALPTADLEQWNGEGGAFELLVAAIGHHGRPTRCDELAVDRSLWIPGALDPFAGISSLTAAVKTWFPDAFERSSASLPDAPEFQHGFAGLVMLADWIGSDRAFFDFADSLDDRMPFARRAAREALRAIGLDAVAARSSLGSEVPGFERVSRFAPREAQARTLALPRPSEGGLVILESETGSGKTEAALGRFVQLFHAGLVDGMVFALPTRTAATQLHARVVEALRLAFPDDATRPSAVLAVPGYLQFDDTSGKRLAPFEVLWNDDPKARIRHRGWAAEQPKRYLAGSVVVGTIDQVLLSSLRVGHAHLRATALLRHLLVVDEVHASDAYMNRILEHVLAFHLSAGGHAFLMSATLGSEVRRNLERAALGHGSAVRDGSLAAALATPYPAIHHANPGGSGGVVRVQNAGLPKTVEVVTNAIGDAPAAVAALALECARHGARALVLRNTVADAVATQLQLERLATATDAALLFRVADVPTLHTARFAREDRGLLDEAIEGRLGKHAPAHGGVVAVATQTVQQSLDLDADILFTDLAPMDVLLQRIGRVHRHAERNPSRPAGYGRARAVVLTSETPLGECIHPGSGEARGKHGVGTVYDDLLILEATRRIIAAGGELRIPEQNRELVEKTTHHEALDELADTLGELWKKHRNQVWGRLSARQGLAGLNVVDRARRFGDYSFKTTDLEERISARLGESDRRAVFAEPPGGPFGIATRELSLPGWMVRDSSNDADTAPVMLGALPGGGFRFAFGPLRFAYDRLGLRRDDTEPNDPTEDQADA